MSNIQKKDNSNKLPTIGGKALSLSYVSNAIIEELNRVFTPEDGDFRKGQADLSNLDAITQILVRKAAFGDLKAIEMVLDRVDGKPAPQINALQVLAFIHEHGMDELYRASGRQPEKAIDTDTK